MFGLSYYLFPIVSAVVWAGTLMAMLIYWSANGKQRYPSMQDGQTIPYISDIGAQILKPLFIAGSAVTVVAFDLTFITETWLRHTRRLAPQTSLSEKIFSGLAGVASIAGGAGLILLSCFDTYRHPRLHLKFLVLFIVGYVVTAIFVCAEYQRLGIHFRQYRVLRASFWLKLAWIIIFVGLSIGFGVENKKSMWNTAAILEWTLGFLFAVFVGSFAIDFFPALQTRGHGKHFPDAEDAKSGGVNNLGGPAYSSDENMTGSQPMAETTTPHHQATARNF